MTIEINLCVQPVNPKGNQSWIFTGRTDAEAETAILWPHDAKNWLIWKDPDVGKDWRWEEKGMAEDEMVGWHHWLDFWAGSRSWWWTGKPSMLQSMGLQSQTQLSNWTELNWSRVTVYSLDILLSQFGTSLLFHVWFWLLLLDLQTGKWAALNCLNIRLTFSSDG